MLTTCRYRRVCTREKDFIVLIDRSTQSVGAGRDFSWHTKPPACLVTWQQGKKRSACLRSGKAFLSPASVGAVPSATIDKKKKKKKREKVCCCFPSFYFLPVMRETCLPLSVVSFGQDPSSQPPCAGRVGQYFVPVVKYCVCSEHFLFCRPLKTYKHGLVTHT